MGWLLRLIVLMGMTAGLVRFALSKALYHFLLVLAFACSWVLLDTEFFSWAPSILRWGTWAVALASIIVYEYLDRKRNPQRWRDQPGPAAKWLCFAAVCGVVLAAVRLAHRPPMHLVVLGAITALGVGYSALTSGLRVKDVAFFGVLALGFCVMALFVPPELHELAMILTFVGAVGASIVTHHLYVRLGHERRERQR